MASRHCASSLRGGQLTIRCQTLVDAQAKTTGRRIAIRSLATAVSPAETSSSASSSAPPPTASMKSGLIIPSKIPSHILPNPEVLTTVYSFPSLEPLRLESYPHTHLSVPLRRDILHKAVVFEGDSSRQGTASTQHRSEMQYSGRKLRPQKGTGRARLGDRSSPMLRGGGVAHGPKPRSFATELPKKLYHKAWRMALSYRYKRGQLVVVDELGVPGDIAKEDRAYWLRWALDGLGWGRNGEGHSFFITEKKGAFSRAMEECYKYGRLRTMDEVDVKNLLEMKRLVVERKALRQMLALHQADLQMPLVRAPKSLTAGADANVPQAVREVSEAEMQRAVAEAQAQSSRDGFLGSSAAAGAGATAAAMSSASSSGLNTLSMDEVDRVAAEAQEFAEEEDEFVLEEEEENFDEEDVEELANELDQKSR